jgi:uncharacterized membrane protein YtjA (UPF0391 family)
MSVIVGACRAHPVWLWLPIPTSRRNVMLHYAIVFFIIALIAALFGFGGIAAGAAGIAKILFFVFLAMAIVSFLVNLVRR